MVCCFLGDSMCLFVLLVRFLVYEWVLLWLWIEVSMSLLLVLLSIVVENDSCLFMLLNVLY